MAELFRLMITSAQDVVIPVRLMNRLGLQVGDELEVEIDDEDSLSLKVVRQVARRQPTKEKLAELKRRDQLPGSPDELKRFLAESAKATKQIAARARSASASS
jgi:antitoxin component of MazEF toxin-antitoxin module